MLLLNDTTADMNLERLCICIDILALPSCAFLLFELTSPGWFSWRRAIIHEIPFLVLLGLYGILIGVVFLLLYMSTLDSYGTPFLAPFVPHIASDSQDGLLKTPIVDITRRPKSIPNVNATRQRGKNG